MIKTVSLDFGDIFRETKIDLDREGNEINTREQIQKYNEITYFDNLLINNKNQILVLLRNENLPEGATTFFTPLRKTDTFICIFDENGKKLIEPILLKNSYPFYFDDNYIKVLEIRKDNSIDIVTYEFFLNYNK